MGFLDSLKRTFNIAGVEIGVVTEDDVCSQGDAIAGQVIIRGTEHELSGDSIELKLEEFWTETRIAGQYGGTTVIVHKTRDENTLADAFTIEPRSEQTYPFRVVLPRNARVSTGSMGGWQLDVRMDVPRAVNPTGSVILNVQPAEELLAILSVCETNLKFQEQVRYRIWNPQTNRMRFHLLPPQALKPELDYLDLNVCTTHNGGVIGELIFDLQEKSVADYFKALTNRDQLTKPIELQRADIFLPNNEPNVRALATIIGQSLQDVLVARQT